MDFQILVPDYLDHLQGFPKQIMQAMALTPFLHTIWYLLPWRYRYDCSGGIQLLQVHTTEERARSLNKSLRGESPSYPTNPLSSPLNSSIEPLSPPKRMPRIRCEAFFVIGRL